MDIKEAIQHCWDISGVCPAGDRDCAYQHDQLADWLEELVAYRAAMPLERVQELSQAEKDGLLVVKPRNDPLTLGELREMDGEPVWIERRDDGRSMWAVYGDMNSPYGVYFGTSVGNLRLPYDEFGKTWLAYCRKPEKGEET